MSDSLKVPERQVRALFNEHSVICYQAYSPGIATPAVSAGTFVPPFKTTRMTWIKPSFLWMMHRSGWATKTGQERILAVQISREGFEWALTHSSLTSYEPATYASHAAWAEHKRTSPVRIQWDPERNLLMEPLPWRTIQIGLSGDAVERYIDDWIRNIVDITPTVQQIHKLVVTGEHLHAKALLPEENPYDLPFGLRRVIGAT
ncbi:DUF4291 domain-containing protein [Amycolatopsis sp. MEPSY49]|uniref:DUF4291 domain-containing protein n=1 Tax=Amycolatopsis sp. MEPSY49 TaxID=3151600 RepID=UPI003EFAAD73